jgi:3-oxoacyl-[acyl-carrier-protein] synthase-3
MVRKLEVPRDRVFVYLRDYGNTIAASIPLGLHFAIESGRLRRGHKVFCLGTAAGLSLGALAFQY